MYEQIQVYCVFVYNNNMIDDNHDICWLWLIQLVDTYLYVYFCDDVLSRRINSIIKLDTFFKINIKQDKYLHV